MALDLAYCLFYYIATRTIQADTNTRITDSEIESIQEYLSLGGGNLPAYFYVEFDFCVFAVIIVSALMLIIYNIMYREKE